MQLAATLAVAAWLAGCGGSLNDDGISSVLPAGGDQATAATTEATAVEAAGKATTAADAAVRPSGVAKSGLTPSVTKVASPGSERAGATPGKAAAESAPPAYKIGAPDVLEITVFKASDLNKIVQVAANGTVNLPLLGDVPVAGRTAQEIERELQRRLGEKYLRDPQVSVTVKEYNSQRITVEGAVGKPGMFPVQGRTTMLNAIAMAQGLDKMADSTVVVLRTTDGKRTAARFDISAIRSGSEPDPLIQPGDTLVVGTSAVKEVMQNLVQLLPVARMFVLF